MNSVNFGSYNAYTDFGLILSSKTIGSAAVKTEMVELPGGDGVIDYTEYFGRTRFNNRKLSFSFQTIASPFTFLTLYSEIQNALHGEKVKVWFDEEPDFYYYGRISVNDWQSNKRIGKIVIDVDAEPWKYKTYKTSRTFDVVTSADIVLVNSRRPSVPDITANANMQLTFGTATYHLSANVTYRDSGITLQPGNNILSVTGTGTIVFEWQEGSL